MGGGWPPTDQGRKLGVVGVGSWLMGRDGESGGWSPPLPVTQHHWPALLGALCGGSDGLRDMASAQHYPLVPGLEASVGQPLETFTSVMVWERAGHGAATCFPNGAWWAGPRPQVFLVSTLEAGSTV